MAHWIFNSKVKSFTTKNINFSLKTPMNLSYWWNLGSLISFSMVIQIMTGILLTLYYDNSDYCFFSIYMIHIETFNGVYIHFIHMNMASFIFLLIYFHMVKGLLFSSFIFLKWVWVSGWVMMMMTMMSAFMGHVLPWGQMSLWGATVITNLLSAIPIIGKIMVEWVWGGYFISNYTVKLFFSLHFLAPLLILTMIMMHLVIFHYYESSALGDMSIIKMEFNPFYYKDLLNLMLTVLIFMFYLYLTSDPENFIISNFMVSPIHIQSEYFLQYYGMLYGVIDKFMFTFMKYYNTLITILIIYRIFIWLLSSIKSTGSMFMLVPFSFMGMLTNSTDYSIMSEFNLTDIYSESEWVCAWNVMTMRDGSRDIQDIICTMDLEAVLNGLISFAFYFIVL